MAKLEQWYVNSTGGAPYTFGFLVEKILCRECDGVGETSEEIIIHIAGDNYTTYREHHLVQIKCERCNGSGRTRKINKGEQQ